jgi:Flp pilus assembly protein TadG
MPSSDDGYVTAETAVVVPALVLLFGVLVWGVMAASAHIQCVDAARAGARAAARGEKDAEVRTAVRSAAPRGAGMETIREGELVRVRVRARTAGPGPLTLGLSAEAVAMSAERAGVAASAAGAGR